MDAQDGYAAREITRDEALDRMVRAEEAMRELAFVLSDLHGEATRIADKQTLAKRQLRACGQAAAGVQVQNGSAYWSEELARVVELRKEREDLKYKADKLKELLAIAWGLITSVDEGDGKKQTQSWQDAYAKFGRDYRDACPEVTY